MNENHIIIGLGGTGGRIIKSFRKHVFQDFTEEEILLMPLGYVYVDSSQEMMDPNDPTWKVLGKNSQLGQENQLFIRGVSLKDQLNNVNNFPGIKNWIGDQGIWENIVGAIANDAAAAQRRRLGRFLFSCKVGEFLTILDNQIQLVRNISGQVDVTFHIIAGLAGGTGSGSIIDTIAQIRKKYPPNIGLGSKFKIFVYCFVPEQNPKPGWDKGFYHANGYAALQELSALSVERFNPHDVTGELDRIDIGGRGDYFNGCYLFTNVNENQVIVDPEFQLPHIVSDFLFQKITLTNGSKTKIDFDKAESFENVPDWKEFDEKALPTAMIKPVRSMRFLSFGIKRIVIPEQEIIEYLTYSFSHQALLQFKYNNWADGLGFLDELGNEAINTYVEDKDTLRKWMLTDNHLKLSDPILPSDRKARNWKTIEDDWMGIISQLAKDAWARNESAAINELAIYCEERYRRNFRKIGVEDYYSIKRRDKRDIASEICQCVERDLFDEWKNGQKAVNDIARIIDILTTNTRARIGTFDNILNNIAQEIENFSEAKKKNELKWSNTGWLTTLLGAKKNLFVAHTVVLQGLYTQKTNYVAMLFARELLAEVSNCFDLLRSQIAKFAQRLNQANESTEAKILMRCQGQGLNAEMFRNAVVKYYDPERVRQLTDMLLMDETIQRHQASNVRNEIVRKVGNEPNFTKLVERITDEVLMDAIESIGKTDSLAAHNALLNTKRVIGVNIIEKLYEEYNVDPNGLDGFVRNIVQYSGTYLNFNDTEIGRTIPNNSAPQPGININIENIIISIPLVAGKRNFVDKLKSAFRKSIPGNKVLLFDEESDKLNEISIMSMTYCFPIRAVNEISFLKQRYDLTLKQHDKNIVQLVLHVEGDGSQYPKLLLPARAETDAENTRVTAGALPYLLIAKALGIIKKQDRSDGTGKKEYGISQTDSEGLSMPTVFLGEKLTQASSKIDEDLSGLLMELVNSELAVNYLHIDKREEVKKALISDVKDIILPECKGNVNDPIYIKFYNASKEAFTILNN